MNIVTPIDLPWTCPQCDAAQRSAWPAVLSLEDDPSWYRLFQSVALECADCGERTMPDMPVVILAEKVNGVSPIFALLPMPPDESGPQGAAEYLGRYLHPEVVRRAVPVHWPDTADEFGEPFLACLLRREYVADQLALMSDRAPIFEGLSRLMLVGSAAETRAVLSEHPILCGPRTPQALAEYFDRLPALDGGNPLWEAMTTFLTEIRADTDEAALAASVARFAAARGAAVHAMADAGRRHVHWLAEHSHEAGAEWDRIAREADALLGFGGAEKERAELLAIVGTTLLKRPSRTPDDVERAIGYLEEGRELALAIGDAKTANAATTDLVIGLAMCVGSHRPTDLSRAADLAAEVMEYHRAEGDDRRFAQAATNRAVILMRSADGATSQSRAVLEQAAALCREALPLRPRESDPLGWSYTAANLALILQRLAEDQPADHHSALREAIGLLRGVCGTFTACGDHQAATQSTLDFAQALLELAQRIHTAGREQSAILAVERSGVVIPVSEADLDLRFLHLAVKNPARYGIESIAPELQRIIAAAPEGEAAELLAEASAVAQDGVRQAEEFGDTEFRGRFAELAAQIDELRLGRTEQLIESFRRARSLIDPDVTPAAARRMAAELGALLCDHRRWAEARDAYADCLSLQQIELRGVTGRDARLQVVESFPMAARAAAYAAERTGDLADALTTLERTRLQAFEAMVGESGPGRVGLLRWDSPTMADIGRAATLDRPLLYAWNTPAGGAMVLVSKDTTGAVVTRSFPAAASSSDFVAMIYRLDDQSQGLMTAQAGGADLTGPIAEIADALGELMQPIVDAVVADGHDQLAIVPCGPLAVTPWAAAVITDPVSGRRCPVVDVLTLTTAPSAAALLLSRRRVGNSRRKPTDGAVVVLADPERPGLSPLRGARLEADTIARELPGRTVLLKGTAATVSALTGYIEDCWILHLACHGSNRLDESENMRLFLSDGDLTLDAITELPRLDTRLVVLSACQTGHADITRLPDSMVGLPVAFLAAGSAAVVSSLWPVDDLATALLIGRMYQELADMVRIGGTDDVPLALRRAQRWLRDLTADEVPDRLRLARDLCVVPETSYGDDRPFREPYYWAGFSVTGW
ncbi:hypothetical protein Q0Z83_043510 [Actinoplanes sichuanensis]|uniref:CHAT domain-containing protein n=1 Tax=Actinoplanes sichuanensis TaxID=512349 RepID=A0ABW4AUV1_9ACTN|nr:CHAT domain-containing protein [Actinoplanes sichuanensis]BEL06160.1 hypothetical protein Q0Z83_043510 [Actinoplanes sichuanensis]